MRGGPPAAESVFLHPGDFHFATGPTQIKTLLGSCIAITLWHPVHHFGGMCHFVLPARVKPEPGAEPDGRYGDEAMELFKRACRSLGTNLSEYEAKIFGGANVYAAHLLPGKEHVGERNATKAMELLFANDANVLVAHVGETGHRRVILDTATGDVWVRHEAHDGALMASTSGSI